MGKCMFYMLVGCVLRPIDREVILIETAPPFIVPGKGCGARFLHRSHGESNPGPSHGSSLHYTCATEHVLDKKINAQGH